jgi:UDP-N-acetylmuramate--alanine ligase
MRIHLIGIGGSGLSAIARLLLESGYVVTGSDRTLSPQAQELVAAGARVWAGHRSENVQGADLVVRSSAIPDDNVEVQAAQAAGIPVLKRAQFLGRLMEDSLNIAVAGTHGKTTTTAMIAWLLTRLGKDPSYIIGGTAKNLGGSNAHAGQGGIFVVEADEYDRMFLGLDPNLIVVTYLEHDHPDCFPTPKDYYAAFVAFTQRLRAGGSLLLAYDNDQARRLAGDAPQDAHIFTYGTHPDADYTAEAVGPNARGGFDYRACLRQPQGGKTALAQISLQVPGLHNVRNSLAALAAIHILYGSQALDQAAQALSSYTGTGRRFDVLGEADSVTIINDYAHHPTEIQATLAAARARYPQRRIWAVWQPHTYSRTRALQADFARSFGQADRVIVTEVYPARERAQDFGNFSAAQVVSQMAHPRAQFIPTAQDAGQYLLENLTPGDVVLVLSAGDADQISARVLAGLRERKDQNA